MAEPKDIFSFTKSHLAFLLLFAQSIKFRNEYFKKLKILMRIVVPSCFDLGNIDKKFNVLYYFVYT